MAVTKLKQGLGTDGQALTDQSSGQDAMRDVLLALAGSAGALLKGTQSSPSVATLDEYLSDQDQEVSAELRLTLGTTGSAGQTDVELQVNGTLAGTPVTVLNTEADGTQNTNTVTASLKKGDRVALVVTAIPTAGADLLASARLSPLEIE